MSQRPMRRPSGQPTKDMALTDDEWIALWFKSGCSPAEMAEMQNVSVRNTYARRAALQAKGHHLPSASLNPGYNPARWAYPQRINEHVQGGCVLIGGDAHIWPGEQPLMLAAFAAVAHEIKPQVIILNGDIIDGARISRHGRSVGWTPTMAEEEEAVRSWLATLPAGDERRYWTMGNHDARVDQYLATNAPEMQDFAGRLTDRFSDWAFGWSVMINETVEVRHRFRSGIHAAYNNALHSGVTVITGHTHQLECKPIVDRRGVRWGIEAGMLGDPGGAQFQYGEGSLSRARPGFVVLSFADDGALLQPELCEWLNGAAWFRGKTWAGGKR